jgi:hypothetical protein
MSRRSSGEDTRYNVWAMMIQRCTNQKNKSWDDYGGRGISVCDRWLHDFAAFAADMGERPSGMTLDRINNDGNYEPSNCRWATGATQRRNARFVRPLTFNGRTMLISDWAAELGITVSSLGGRLDRSGWSVEKALTTPRRYKVAA